MDQTGSKGTGKWTVQQAADLAVAAPTITASLDGRYLSAIKPQRVAASKVHWGALFWGSAAFELRRLLCNFPVPWLLNQCASV